MWRRKQDIKTRGLVSPAFCIACTIPTSTRPEEGSTARAVRQDRNCWHNATNEDQICRDCVSQDLQPARIALGMCCLKMADCAFVPSEPEADTLHSARPFIK